LGPEIEPQHAPKYPSDIHRMVKDLKDLVFFCCTRIESNAKLTSEVWAPASKFIAPFSTVIGMVRALIPIAAD
jgi:hypothetical protein